MSQAGAPVIFGGGSYEALRRKKLTEGLLEGQLQELLDAMPDLLPAPAIDDRLVGPLFSLGREIPTEAGSIDNLFITKSGHLVVVEMKLWRNPEARRKVVAQILDYAKVLHRWTYQQVNELWKARHPQEPLHERLDPEEDENVVIDRVQGHLTAGRMTLLIVGDGIQSNLEQLVAMVGSHPEFLFRLGLVEIRLHDMGDGRMLAIPHTMARTQEIERATVTVNYVGDVKPDVAVGVPPVESPRARSARGTLSREGLLASLREVRPHGGEVAEVADVVLRELEAAEIILDWKSSNCTVKVDDPNDPGSWISIGGITRSGIFWVYPQNTVAQVTRSATPEMGAMAGQRLRDLFLAHGAYRSAAGRQLNLDLETFRDSPSRLVDIVKKAASDLRSLGQAAG